MAALYDLLARLAEQNSLLAVFSQINIAGGVAGTHWATTGPPAYSTSPPSSER